MFAFSWCISTARGALRWILLLSAPKIVFVGIFSWALLLLCSHFVSYRIPTFRALSAKTRFLWHMTVLRGVFGLFAVFVGIHTTFYDDHLVSDVVLATSLTSRTVVLISGSFFLLEAALVTICDLLSRQWSRIMCTNLWLAMANFLLVAIYGNIHYFSCISLLLEISTPFSCLSWILARLGWSSSLSWRVNQFVLLHTFHLRSVVECYLFVVTYRHWDVVWTKMPWPIFLTLYGQLIAVTFFLTPYWTYKQTVLFVKNITASSDNSLTSSLRRKKRTPGAFTISPNPPVANCVSHATSNAEDQMRLKTA